MTDPTLLVGLGGVAGALARHLLGERIEEATYDTLAVNVIGSFLLGVLVAVPVGSDLLLLAGTGFCGAFTTFSSFAYETVRLAEGGYGWRAVRNAVVNLVGALVAVGLGTVVAGLL
ncbi:fluoride efflux transporter CrcB [Haloglomus litoreum]|uniref:fluoride efflux transporter CrcB n=1 Tax=Haloglomus litoreum TaxID=3034026 RepID=UPI0023E83E8B|nr:fluoride efflux transporter CrcB [Haloglomus sp. DT116]